MSDFTSISDDIVAAINAGTYAIEDAEPFDAERVQIIDPELIDTDELLVLVAPRDIEISILNRNSTLNVYVFQVAVIKHVDGTDNVDFDLWMDFVEEVGDTLIRLASATQPNSSWIGLTLPVSYSTVQLREKNLFFAVIETRYRMGR